MKIRIIQHWFLAILFSLSACSTSSFRRHEFEKTDVIGRWKAKYEQLQVPQSSTFSKVLVSGVEDLTIREDGTFTHVFYSPSWRRRTKG